MIATKITMSRRYYELIREFPLQPIRSKAQLNIATEILDRLFGRTNDAGEEAYLSVLSDLVDSYERANGLHFESDATGLEVLRVLMEEHRMTQAALAERLGIGKSAMSLILSGDREITAAHARALGEIFSVPAGAFIAMRRAVIRA